MLFQSAKPIWFNLLSNYYVIRLSHIYPYDTSVFWSSSCPQYSTHSWGVFSCTSLFIKYPGHSEALSIFKITSFRYEKFPRFFSVMISIFLKLHLFVYWNFCVPLCCFPYFLYLSIYSTFWISPQLYLSTHTETSFILFLSSKNFFCVCILDVLFCSGFTIEVSSLYLRTKLRMGIGWLWGRWCQELVNFILSFTVTVAYY